jgi:2-dehydropantoate 2-reductase
MGAGAVGGYYGACLARGGHDVLLVARGENLRALREGGVRVGGAMGDFDVRSVTADEGPSGEADLVLFCVKNYDLEAAARIVEPCGGVVLTLQNGVDAPYAVRAILGDRVLAGTTGIVADLAQPGYVQVVSAYAWIRFGEPEGGGVGDRVRQVQTWLSVDGIEPIAEPDVRIALWQKMSLMCGMAGLTTLHQRPMGEILGDPQLRRSFESLLAECEAVARAKGVALPEEFMLERIAYAERIDPGAMSSMSRDFARGRRIELETFNGAVARMGAELGVPVPENEAVDEAIRAALPA